MAATSFTGGELPPYTPNEDERTLGILAHALAIVSFLGPLIIYLVKKDDSSYVAEQAKESLNFQITVFLLCVALAITIVGLVLIWAVGIADMVFVVIASISASERKIYRYPLSIRFIK